MTGGGVNVKDAEREGVRLAGLSARFLRTSWPMLSLEHCGPGLKIQQVVFRRDNYK